MRPSTGCSRVPLVIIALAAALALPACTVEAGDEAAHALAEKFAAEASSQDSAGSPQSLPPQQVAGTGEAERHAEAQREAEEAEMLARARAEAEEWRLAEQKRLQDIEQAEAERERLRALKAAEEERKRHLAEEDKQHTVAEAGRLAEIAAQEKARKAEEARRTAKEEKQRKTADDWRRFEEEQRHKAAEAKRRAEIAAQRELRRLTALRQLEEEGRRKAEQAEAIAALAAAEAARKAQAEQRARESPRVETYSSPRALGGPPPHEPAGSGGGQIHSFQVAVLLVMQPGGRGIRRFSKTADPILCVGTRCYVSNGADQPARAMTRRHAFGPAVAMGIRAGRCRRSLTCVFRGVDLEHTMAVVQPIDLRILRHDRREPRAVVADPTCRVERKHLTCSRPVVASDYKLWVIPESVAGRAGAVALETAVRAGLPGNSSVARAQDD